MLSALAGSIMFRISLGDYANVQAEADVQGVSAQAVCDVVNELREAGFAKTLFGVWQATPSGVNALFDGSFEYEPHEDPTEAEYDEDARVLDEARAEFKRRPVWAAGREGIFDALLAGGFRPSEAYPATREANGIQGFVVVDCYQAEGDGAEWRGLDVELPEARDRALACRYARRFAGLTREQWGKAEAAARPDERAALDRINTRMNERVAERVAESNEKLRALSDEVES